MLRRPLGNTGIEVSPLGLGTVKFGRNTGIDYRRAYPLPSDGRIADLLAVAQREGINLLDTAPAYGTSEARIGEAIEGHRDDWVLCTKAGEEFDGAKSRYDFSEDAVLTSVEGSLARLRTDNVDILLLHSDGQRRRNRACRRVSRAGEVEARRHHSSRRILGEVVSRRRRGHAEVGGAHVHHQCRLSRRGRYRPERGPPGRGRIGQETPRPGIRRRCRDDR